VTINRAKKYWQSELDIIILYIACYGVKKFA